MTEEDGATDLNEPKRAGRPSGRAPHSADHPWGRLLLRA